MDENEIPEIVGSKDLREVFAAKPVVRGTFFVNAIEIIPLAAAGIASLLEQINRYADKAFVDASVDENYHLVLEARSPAPILIRLGRLLDPKAAQDERNTVLVDLGLPETQPGLAATAVVHGVAPGPAPEERRRLRLERGVKSGAIPASALIDAPLDMNSNPPRIERADCSLEWEKKVIADLKIAEPVPEQRQEPKPEPPQQPPPLPRTVLGGEERAKPRLPEIGWGGDIDNRGPVGFPS